MAPSDKNSASGKSFYTEASRVMLQSIDYISDDYPTSVLIPVLHLYI